MDRSIALALALALAAGGLVAYGCDSGSGPEPSPDGSGAVFAPTPDGPGPGDPSGADDTLSGEGDAEWGNDDGGTKPDAVSPPETDVEQDAAGTGDGEGTAGADAEGGPGFLDVTFEDSDTECEPSCAGRVCGPDGCGSVCGFCEYGTACNDTGACIPVCDPITPCAGKACGPDGCGGTCGACGASFECGEDGLCYEGNCVPNCQGKVCGPDGCGGVCGSCAGALLCQVETGSCVSNPCVDAGVGLVGFAGVCVSKTEVLKCTGTELVVEDCKLKSPLFGCVWDPLAASYACQKPPDCIPDCIELGKQCGDGGCNYSCGSCFSGWSCVDFTCVPEAGGACGTVSTIGTCIEGKKYFCSSSAPGQGQILIEDCPATGKACKFNPAMGQFTCQ